MTKKKILIVDDEPYFNVNHAEALEIEGYNVKRVSDVDEALHLLGGDTKFDLIVMDLLMPARREHRNEEQADLRQTGVRFHQEIREVKRISSPILVLSAVRDERVLQQIRDCERNNNLNYLHFHKKPITIPKLIKTVSEILNGRSL